MSTERVNKVPDYDDAEITALAQEIVRYLESHPNAVDTRFGIVKWWLRFRRYEEALDKVQRALDYLVDQGLVTKNTTLSGEALYRRIDKGS